MRPLLYSCSQPGANSLLLECKFGTTNFSPCPRPSRPSPVLYLSLSLSVCSRLIRRILLPESDLRNKFSSHPLLPEPGRLAHHSVPIIQEEEEEESSNRVQDRGKSRSQSERAIGTNKRRPRLFGRRLTPYLLLRWRRRVASSSSSSCARVGGNIHHAVYVWRRRIPHHERDTR